jgi:radical SAM protein with 4Fe4S-binding SPASM domain
MIQYSTERNLITAVSTNGLLLNQATAIKLIESGLKYIIIGVDGTTAKVYKTYRRGGDFELVKNNIKRLCQIKKDRENRFPIVELQCVVMKNNENDAPSFFTLGRELGVDRVVLKRFSTLLRFKHPEVFLPRNNNLILETHRQNPVYKRNFCETPWRALVVTSDGSVLPCCSDFFSKQNMGNAFEDDIKKIWNNKKYTDFRKQVIKKITNIAICTDCSTIKGQEGSFIETRQLS